MAYTAPTITEAGLTIPTYMDIITDLIEQTKAIYGQDIYLGTDSQDYQFISIFALKTFDVIQLLQMVYNNRSPVTAIGAALDSIVKINGIQKKTGSYSACEVILSGDPSAQISNGVVEDITGYPWSLPSPITIGSGGTVTVTATCQVMGPVSASPGDINKIVTPTYGWDAVNNVESAVLGAYVETDSALRARQAISVSLNSQTVLDALKSALTNITEVTRSEVYENDTNTTNADGIQAHSIAAVVDGGSNADIANVLFLKKGPGVYTQGDVLVDITDTFGLVNTIRFYRPAPIGIDVSINVKSITGYTDQTTTDIKAKIVSYLNALTIGSDVSVSSLWGASLSAMASLTSPTFSITSLTAAKHGETTGTDDIEIAFNEAARGNIANVTINVT